jgi:UDP-glucoronosyl and UDP-glucosyl transferase
MTSLESSIWWIEYVMRHKGAKHLHSYNKTFSYLQILMVDIVLTVAAAVYIGCKVLQRVVGLLKMVIISILSHLRTIVIEHRKMAQILSY